MLERIFTESECQCMVCKMMCMTPCWGTPEEMKAIIDAGYSHRLKLHLEGYYDRLLYVIQPKQKGGYCTFSSERGNCVLHKKGLKPLEGRVASCKGTYKGQDIRNHVAESWDSKDAYEMALDFHVDEIIGLKTDS